MASRARYATRARVLLPHHEGKRGRKGVACHHACAPLGALPRRQTPRDGGARTRGGRRAAPLRSSRSQRARRREGNNTRAPGRQCGGAPLPPAQRAARSARTHARPARHTHMPLRTLSALAPRRPRRRPPPQPRARPPALHRPRPPPRPRRPRPPHRRPSRRPPPPRGARATRTRPTRPPLAAAARAWGSARAQTGVAPASDMLRCWQQASSTVQPLFCSQSAPS